MPIYAYRCESCGHAMDVLRKVSDPALTTCPACGAEALRKQVTAAGFQLKGSGWYVTDFRGGSPAGAADAKTAGKPDSASNAARPSKPGDAAPAASSGAGSEAGAKAAPAVAAPAAASGPAPASGSSSKSAQ